MSPEAEIARLKIEVADWIKAYSIVNEMRLKAEVSLPSRFQIDDEVRVGRLRAVVTAVTFRSGKVYYHVRSSQGEFGPLDSDEVSLALRVVPKHFDNRCEGDVAEDHFERAVNFVFERHRNVLSCDGMNDPRDMARRLVSTVLEAL